MYPEHVAAAPSAPGTITVIDTEDPELVPSTLTAFVAAARPALAAITVNASYPALVAVTALEDVMAATAEITKMVTPYVGDLSVQGGRAMTRTEELLANVRVELNTARHQLHVDDDSEPAAIPDR